MPAFEDKELGADGKRPETPSSTNPMVEHLHKVFVNGSPAKHHSTLEVPGENEHGGTIEVPATRSAIAESEALMHSLSMSPSQVDRRGSRNSFGASLPIPRSKRQSRLSSVATADGRPTRPGMPAIQPTREILSSQLQDMSSITTSAAKNMAFAFDIDGVLVHGDRLIPEGKRVLEILNGDNELGIKIPHIFLTNGSGKPEAARCAQLSKILHSPVSTEQFIQSHTPMSALAEYYETVLVVGGENYQCREVAKEYGFKNIIVPNDIVAAQPTISPLKEFFTAEQKATSNPKDFSKIKINAILVFSDSRDYATDLQIIMDLLQSEDGVLGTMAKDPVSQRIPIYFSQGDLLCPTEHPVPRMSQGTFRIALEAIYKAVTGVELERVVYGKPELATYKYADEVMASWMGTIHNDERLPENIYMIGDNPQSDIIGGNMYGWKTCLVRTGVFQGGENDEKNPASFGVFNNVLEAVQTAVKKELGEDFKFNWSDAMNPVTASHAISAIE
ncbi:putative CDP-alcohol phosphatidyltransferase class-I family protein [Lachnellula hyalina]|uniref:Putative CDP-alcohol phosphatidyltransferase class-I family protein n=1 Tax=Lachnellula hyalina TaxID=1316788 RepID=A0A8H8QY77_9HELO|nr:putative CDP-alcohol phosphatidyltransferase class-I family protein [Lachnellula hyalina]TVY25052.1 putative CDP-alcohol phosphatidyltransferase class-I family protein [Lachnellula hyalina]